jgi:hypothetical protein
MGKKKGDGPRKRRTREHVLADLGVNHVERHMLRCGYAVERVQRDYGLDLFLWTFASSGEIEDGMIWIQVKATDRLEWLKNRQAIVIRVERAHLLYWLNAPLPVILIVYDGSGDLAYWVYVQRDLGGGKVFELRRAGTTFRVHVPVANLVNEEAIWQFARLRPSFSPRTREKSDGVHNRHVCGCTASAGATRFSAGIIASNGHRLQTSSVRHDIPVPNLPAWRQGRTGRPCHGPPHP